MPLNLMYITRDPAVARIAERHGVDRIFVDMEFVGKSARQGGMDSVQNHHTVADVRRIREALTTAELLVRVNPIHDELDSTQPGGPYPSSADEIDAVVDAGADVLMLPYFSTVAEAAEFVRLVNGRAQTILLVETPPAAQAIDELCALPGIDQIHIGINDLCLGMGRKFMFELLADGTVERLCRSMQRAGHTYGFGGIARIGEGLVPAEMIIREHYRLGSQAAILSRAFCNASNYEDPADIEAIFATGVRQIRELEAECARKLEAGDADYFACNRQALKAAVAQVVG